MPELRPYQLEGVLEIRNKRRVILADDMSMGKTAEAISAKTIIDKDIGYEAPALVVCPSSVVDHWGREVRKWYKKGKDSRVEVIQTSTYQEDVRRAKGSDFVITTYATLSRYGENDGELDRLRNLGFSFGILDEAHNARNPDSIRSLAARRLFHSAPYLVLTTGSPLPNTIVDIYSLLNLLDKDAFPITGESNGEILGQFYSMFKSNPGFIKDVLNTRMLRRNAEDYLHKKMPKLNSKNLEVMLVGEHRDVYTALFENGSIRPTDKLKEMIRASIDPNLVNRRFLPDSLAKRIGSMESSVYKALDEVVESVINGNGKILLFTDIKTGVVKDLLERYSKYGFLGITGDTNYASSNGETGEREAIRNLFQRDSNCKGLITTTVMDEGCDLTAATDIIHLTLPFVPTTFDQRNRRSQRVNAEIEKDEVNVRVIKPYISDSVPVITDGIERVLEDKREIIDYLLTDPHKVTKDMLDRMKYRELNKSRIVSGFLKTPERRVLNHLGSLKGLGSRRILKKYEENPRTAQNFANLYAYHWEGYYGGNATNLSVKIINGLHEKIDGSRVIDVGSGPFSLSRKLGIPVVNLDINKYMIEAGRILEKEGLVPMGNIGYSGIAHKMPFDDSYFTLANCSLVLHMTEFNRRWENKMSEREASIREINRVLKTGGNFMFTLPYSTIGNENVVGLHESLDHLGFEVLPCTGFYRGPKDSRFSVFAGAARKKGNPKKSVLPFELITWKMDAAKSRKVKPSEKRKHSHKLRPQTKPEIINDFYYSNGKSIDEVLA